MGWGIIHALNTVWAGSVESNSVPFHFGWDTLLISAAASILICLLSVAIPSLRIARMNVSEALTVHGGGSASTTGNTGKPWGLLPVVGLTILIVNGFMTLPSSAVLVMIAYFLMLTGSGIFLYRQRSRRFLLSSFLLLLSLVITIERGISYGHSPDGTGTSVFITMGLLLLITSLVLLFMGIRHSTLTARFGGYVARIALSGVRRRTGRTALMTATMSLAVFAIVALYAAESSERQGMEENMDGMTGGYDVRAVLTVPYTSDMGSDGHGFLSDTASLGIRSVGNEGGSCSNMNARFPPQIIGVPGEFRDKNTVTFRDSIHGGKTDREIWQSINDTASPYIPVTVDYNTLVWVYSGSLGDVYSVRGDDGGQYELKVVSIMDSSIYAGMFVMSSENILRVYPQSAKYTYYLFSTDGDPGEKALEIERELAEYGVDAVPTGELARENLEFEASYMGIFRVFLVLGLLSGTAGVAVMIYRSTRERRREIGILRSLGVGSGGIMGAFLLETAFICLPGIIIGSAAGVTAAYVSFGMGASSSFVFPLWGAVVIPAFIFALSLAFSAIPAYSASGVAPVETLRQS